MFLYETSVRRLMYNAMSIGSNGLAMAQGWFVVTNEYNLIVSALRQIALMKVSPPVCKRIDMKTNKLLAAVLFSAFALPVFAQNTATPNINKTQQNQENRIANGVRSGELTAKETQNLQKREGKIEADKQAAKADGKVTNAERRKIKREQARASKAIYKKKHNRRKA